MRAAVPNPGSTVPTGPVGPLYPGNTGGPAERHGRIGPVDNRAGGAARSRAVGAAGSGRAGRRLGV